MREFAFSRVDDAGAAIRATVSRTPGQETGPTSARAQFLAGGTTLLDLMKLDSMRPEVVVDINGLETAHGRIDAGPGGLRLGGLVRMAQAADHPDVKRDYPVIAQSLALAASAQIRNMASLGGNVLQRTRCQYFRDPSWTACNKRKPGSGCAALDGVNRGHAVLGVGTDCIASYPGDFAQALVALGATVDVEGPGGKRTMPFEGLHRGPETPSVETVLAPGDLITGFSVPAGPWTRRSLYLKIRDRASYQFGLVTVAVALDTQNGIVAEARIALGGVAYRPWRAREAEVVLRGKRLDETSAEMAAMVAFSGATTREQNAFKPELGRRTLVRALLQAAALEI